MLIFLCTKISLLSKEDKRYFFAYLDNYLSVSGECDGFRVVCVVQNGLHIAESIKGILNPYVSKYLNI
jgi:hypothetical protein